MAACVRIGVSKGRRADAAGWISPEDEFFIIQSNAKAYLDQEFTSDKDKLYEVLNKTGHGGPSAIRDAVGDALDYAKKRGKEKMTELLVITDGDDTLSHETTENLVRKGRESGIAIYCIGEFAHLNWPTSIV